jgi:hypothetical protein
MTNLVITIQQFKTHILSICFYMMDAFVKSKVWLEEQVECICDKYPVIPQSYKTMCQYTNHIYKFVMRIKEEPGNENWVSIFATRSKPVTDNEMMFGVYPKVECTEMYTNVDPSQCIFNQIRVPFEFELLNFYEEDFIYHPLMVFKNASQQYWIRHLPPTVVHDPAELPSLAETHGKSLFVLPSMSAESHGNLVFIPSKVRFLSVEYSHPKMKKPVPLTLPPSMMMIGNELLSSAFVLRMLMYMGHRNAVFDHNYTLILMDSDIRYFELRYGEHIELDHTMYKLCGVPKFIDR